MGDIASLKRTPLYDLHARRGGKLVDFAGYALPIQYEDSIMEATQHCRSEASLFDVSHMLGSSVRGKDATAFLESLVVADLKGLKDGTGTLSVMTNEKGGIIDDTVITKVNSNDFYVVLNAGCAEKDQALFDVSHMLGSSVRGKDVLQARGIDRVRALL